MNVKGQPTALRGQRSFVRRGSGYARRLSGAAWLATSWEGTTTTSSMAYLARSYRSLAIDTVT
jgi:hypothetical protein